MIDDCELVNDNNGGNVNEGGNGVVIVMVIDGGMINSNRVHNVAHLMTSTTTMVAMIASFFHC